MVSMVKPYDIHRTTKDTAKYTAQEAKLSLG